MNQLYAYSTVVPPAAKISNISSMNVRNVGAGIGEWGEGGRITRIMLRTFCTFMHHTFTTTIQLFTFLMCIEKVATQV